MPKKKTTTRKLTWRSIPDDILFRLTPPTTGSAESLCPTTSTVHRAISGDPTARVVIDAYAFRFPVTIVEVLPCE